VKRAIRKLRLREGDILVVRNREDMESLVNAGEGMKGIPNCPIVIARESIHRLSKEYLRKLLAA
jgi:hypothetical protein